MTYFNNCKTVEELKKEYKRLAMKNHPDRGGDVEIMKQINAEYDEAFKKLKDIHTNANGERYEKENKEAPAEFINIINEFIKYENIIIEVCGSWLWVSGDTKPIKETLKKYGFKWHSSKKRWFKAPIGYVKHSKKNFTMDEIRDMYGSEEYEAQGKKKITA